MKVLFVKIISSIAAYVKAHTVVSIVTAAVVLMVGIATPIIVNVVNENNNKSNVDSSDNDEIISSNENDYIEGNNSITSTPGTSSDTETSSESGTTSEPEVTSNPTTPSKPTASNQDTISSTQTTLSQPTPSNKPVVQNKLKTLNYQYYSNCIDGIMLVKNDANKIGMIDASGKLLVDYKYSNGLVSDGGYVVFEKRYVYDKTGKLVFEDQNATIEHCGNGIVLLTETGEWEVEGHDTVKSRKVYKKLDGTEIYFSFGNALCGQFNKQGYAWLVKNGCWCCRNSWVEIINLNGEIVQSFGNGNHGVIANSTWIVSEDGFVLTDNEVSWGYCRYMNIETVKEDIYNSIWNEKSLYKLLESKGEWEFTFHPSNNDNGYPCFSVNSLSEMSLDNNYYLFDIEKNKIIAEYSYIDISDSEYILVKNSNGKWGYIDKNGKEYKFYDDATSFDDGYAMVKIDGKLYVIDENFNVVSEGIEGDSVSALYNKSFGVKKGNEKFIVKFNP